MCGIVGVLGSGPVAGSIVDALKRLEYRGYDSAGVATLENGKLERRRAEGKLKNLEAKLAVAPLSGSIGIGHTRWATHGKPTETNAHPHASRGLAVVHNGIIENFKALREELAAKGHAFATETDSEIAAFVVEDELATVKSPIDAVHAALKRLRGAFALVYLFEGEDNLLIGARQGAPLAVGYGDGAMYLGSDALALAPFTDRVAYLEEGDWVVVRREGADIRDASGEPVHRRIQRSPVGSLLAEKGNYRHFMAKEIHEQPEVVGHTLAHYVDMAAMRLKPFAWPVDPKTLGRISIVGCGTAYMAGLIGKYWIERFARLPVEIDVASECRYREAPVERNGLTIVISQSGETADTLASLRYVKDNGSKTVGVATRPASRGSPTRLPRPSRGPRSGSPRPKPSPVNWRRWRASRLALAARAAPSTRRRKRPSSPNSSGRPGFSPRRSSSSPRRRLWGMRLLARATCSISAAARPIRSRSKAR
jgi:glutamine---fructose-6-phosphate transaminase (isomerizing)